MNTRTLALILMACVCISCSEKPVEESIMKPKTYDLSPYSSEKPKKPMHLLFIHHSTGGQLLADKGQDKGENSIYVSHPNGGGLRSLLEANNYIVHEASYHSIVGDKTDICDWHAKFRDYMDQILRCKHQDEFFADGTRNRIVIFKSCFPNNWIVSDGTPPGDPDACEKTLANAQAAYREILPYFKQHPDTLFVVMTAPPLARPVQYKRDKILELLKSITARPDTLKKIGNRARTFNTWLVDVENGWLKEYKLKNVVVFDYYDALTNHGQSNWSVYPTGDGADSHPSSEGNVWVVHEFVPFLNSTVRRMGMN